MHFDCISMFVASIECHIGTWFYSGWETLRKRLKQLNANKGKEHDLWEHHKMWKQCVAPSKLSSFGPSSFSCFVHFRPNLPSNIALGFALSSLLKSYRLSSCTWCLSTFTDYVLVLVLGLVDIKYLVEQRT